MKSLHLSGIPPWFSYGVLSFLSLYVTLWHTQGDLQATPIVLHTGFALAGVMLHSYWVLPGILAGTVLAFQVHADPIIVSSLHTAGTIGATLLAGGLLRRPGAPHLMLQSTTHLSWFLLIALLIAPLLPTLACVALLYLADNDNLELLLQTSGRAWLAHAIGVALITPLVIAWRTRGGRNSLRHQAEALLLGLATLAVCALLQGELIAKWLLEHPLSYLPFPVIVWAFLRFRSRASTLVVLSLSAATVWGSYSGLGPFAGSNPLPGFVPLQTYLLIMALTMLIGIAQLGGRQQRMQRMALASKVITHSPEGIIVTDPGGVILSANPAFFVSTGFQPGDIAGQSIRKLTSVHHNQEFFTNIWRQLRLKGQWEGEIWNRNKAGEIHPQWLSLTAITDRDGHPTHYLGIYSDVSRQKQIQERMHRLAYHDVLTGLPNRQLFSDRLNQALKYAGRKNSRLALFIVDLDRFKNINDTLGHSVGDKVLQHTAERMNGCIRQTDTLSRLGGDEFSIIIQDINENFDTVQVAEKLVNAFQTPLRIEEHELFMTPSIGISLFPSDANSSEELIKYAETAMYRAKDLGGNGFQFFATDMSDPIRWSLTIENALRRAVEQNSITLDYQPQFDLRSGDLIGLEALARWHHGLDKTPPDIFVKVAEETGLIHRMGDHILQMACQQAAHWQQEGFSNLRVSVNISPLQLKQSDFIDRLQQIAREAGTPPKLIELEIAESTLMENASLMESLINMLSVCGFRIAIDDYGTGYSSLSYIKRLAIDRIKIDNSFIKDLPEAANDAAICSAIITMAHNLNLQVIAKGVETDEQMDYLRKVHCDEIQGYIFSHPVGAQEISEMIHQGYWHISHHE
ncbi:MAG: EAL domain-containing protein [Gammaproteobacteria bacterium]|nr:EAL domain-containing protein [Gammaproteobacteria bacterium]MCB1849454.1 EAL domain-containing protein [Gammaproteobacteria bacterium]MCP5418591.1 EAL domain-containing protein [Chromatiaceae bacterium]